MPFSSVLQELGDRLPLTQHLNSLHFIFKIQTRSFDIPICEIYFIAKLIAGAGLQKGDRCLRALLSKIQVSLAPIC